MTRFIYGNPLVVIMGNIMAEYIEDIGAVSKREIKLLGSHC
jgi:hypothetical protein